MGKSKPEVGGVGAVQRRWRTGSYVGQLWDSRQLRLIFAFAAVTATLLIFRWSLSFLRDTDTPTAVMMPVAIGLGVVGVWVLYWGTDTLLALLPLGRLSDRLRPIVFVGPALALLGVFLIYPTIVTIWMSLRDARSENFVGLENYRFAFTNDELQTAFLNNLVWLVVVTGVSVALGLLIAVLVDRVRYEAAAKSLIFLPMAISFVGASVIWKFMYAFQPAGRPQIGLLNALVVAGGGEPVGWLIERQFNTFALIAIMIWLQTGFCLVILSAALKAIPKEILDAARIDGASETQVFLQIIIPALRGTLITVGTAVLIAVLKVFDIVYVMTNGQYDTEVVANRMYAEMFKYKHYGRGSALAVILLLAVVPVMIANVRSLRQRRS